MILNSKPLTLAEAQSYFKKGEEKKPVEDYFKSFIKLSKEDSLKLMDEIKSLNNPKLKEEDIIKIADMIPKDAEDLNKILIDVVMNEAEINSILDVIKKY